MTIRGFDHLYIESAHWDASREFWMSLGLTEVATWGEGGHRACKLASDQFAVVLAESSSPCSPTMHLSVDDAKDVQRELQGAPGVKITTPAENTHWGTSWIRVATPDGHEIALECPRPMVD